MQKDTVDHIARTGVTRRDFLRLSALASAGLLVGCAVNPVTGQQELMLLSEADEVRLGRQTDAQIMEEYGIYEDEALGGFIKRSCRRMGMFSHRSNLNYQAKVLDASVVNAFAVPGGYVYFTRGILAYLNSEAEFAGVMGHEIGHITARHSAQQYSRAQVAQIGLGLGMAVSETLRGFSELAQQGVAMLFLKFSRDNERQADDLGVEYATRAGYDAKETASFFETLKRMQSSSDRSGLPSWFSTHPDPVDRIGAIQLRAQEWRQRLGVQELAVNKESYLDRINGLTYGDDPQQGYVAKGIFYHPGLRFQFPKPRGWKLNNTPSQVQIADPNGEAGILFSITTGRSPRDAAQGFAYKNRLNVLSSRELRVNGLYAHQLIFDLRSKGGVIRAVSYFIEKDRHIFVFHGFAPRQLFQRYQGTFEYTMGGFRRLDDPKRIDVQPDSIRIRRAKKDGSVERNLKSLGVSGDKLKETALLNGRRLNDVIPAGTKLKVIQKE